MIICLFLTTINKNPQRFYDISVDLNVITTLILFWGLGFEPQTDLAPFIMPADIIALKRLSSWKEYIPGDFICVVVTKDFKVLRKVSPKQNDEQSITFIQMIDGTPVESNIPKDIIVEIYKVVGNYRRQ